MENFLHNLLKNKAVSIWGIGYLGYTSILKLQENGFLAYIHDFNIKRLDELFNQTYPGKEQQNSWSKNGQIPSFDLEKITLCKNVEAMFANQVHIISFPSTSSMDYSKLADVFISNRNKLSESLIIFQSAGKPGSIEQSFITKLEENKINIMISSVFRNDWTIENFLLNNKYRVISGNSDKAIDTTSEFLNLLKLEVEQLPSIKEAEIYENAKTSLEHTIIAFFNQLSISYPDTDINSLSKILLKNISFHENTLGVSNVDYKSEQAIKNLLMGSDEEFLTLLKEAGTVNISFLFYYVELLKRKNINNVTILGLASYNSLKDISLSPSMILAEYLHNNNISIAIHDENFSREEIKEVLPYCQYLNYEKDKIKSQAVIVMSLCEEYKFFTQKKLQDIGFLNSKYIFDNTGFFKDFDYKNGPVYHCFGDGNLSKVN